MLARHRYRHLSLTGSTPCRVCARCVVCVSTSSLSSLVIAGFDTLPRSMCGLRSHAIAAHVIFGFPTLTLLISLWGKSTPWVVFALERRDRFCGRVMLLLYCIKAVLCSSVRAVIALPSSGVRRCPCYCTERRSPPLVRECAPAGLTLFLL